MIRVFLFKIALLYCVVVHAQSYEDSIYLWQQKYKSDFLTDEHSPLKAADTGYLSFFAPNKVYCVNAKVKLTPKSPTFDMATHSGKVKPYRCYALLAFVINGKTYKLEVYQGLDLIKNPELEDYLFVPFNDYTNNEETYGGGRYLEFRIGDIVNNELLLDFNKAYNPYCAFAEGYSCPIPPNANRLKVKVLAGEKQYAKKHEE